MHRPEAIQAKLFLAEFAAEAVRLEHNIAFALLFRTYSEVCIVLLLHRHPKFAIPPLQLERQVLEERRFGVGDSLASVLRAKDLLICVDLDSDVDIDAVFAEMGVSAIGQTLDL